MFKIYSYIFLLIVVFAKTDSFSQTKTDLKTITKIEKSVISDLDIIIDTNYNSNQPIVFQCIFKTKNGKQIKTSGYVSYVFLNLDGKNARINTSGELELNHANIGIESTINMTFRLKKDTNITKTMNLPINYKGKLCIDYRGEKGKSGEHGKNNNRKDNDAAGVLGFGENGKNGENGNNGKSISVYIEKRNVEKLSKDLLIITVLDSITTTTNIYYSDPVESQLTINISGRNGGNGGRGAKGNLPPAGNGVPRIAEDGWYGGNGGNGGSGGDCGKITLSISPSAIFYKPFIEIVSTGGIGGKGGLPGRRGEIGDLEYMGKRYPAESYSVNPPSDLYENPGKPGVDGNCYNGNIKIIDK